MKIPEQLQTVAQLRNWLIDHDYDGIYCDEIVSKKYLIELANKQVLRSIKENEQEMKK